MQAYLTFPDFLRRHFRGKMQKITVNGGFSCPNRDGSIGTGGCTYCNNASFSPGYCLEHRGVVEQLAEGKGFFARKYPSMRYLAYFQSFTGTNAPIDELMRNYSDALGVEGVDGLIIGTRPDCIPQPLVERLALLNEFVMMEFGAESSHNVTLERVNRCHTWEQTVDAVQRSHSAGLPVGLHFIMGLPGETEAMMLETVRRVNDLPVDVVKFHQLQIIKGTPLERKWREGTAGVTPWEIDAYLELCAKIVGLLRKDIAIERFTSQAPDHLLVAPCWGLKNHEFVHKLQKKISSINFALWQNSK